MVRGMLSNKLATYGASIALALIMGLVLVGLLPTPVQAQEPVNLEIGGEGATSWNIGNIKPGDSGIKTVELRNAGSKKGVVTIWISDIEEVDYAGDGAVLDDYLLLYLSHERLETNIELPATIHGLPQNPSDPNYVKIISLNPGETIALDWQWEFSETGQPQNDAQGDSVSFTINYLLEELPSGNEVSANGASGVGVPTYGLETSLLGVTRTLRVTYSDNTLFGSYVIFDPESGYSLTLERGTKIICHSGCSNCGTIVPSKLTASLLQELSSLPDSHELVSPVCDLAGYIGSERCQGVTFDPPIELMWKYDPGELPGDVTEKDMVFASYDQDANEWFNLDFAIDPAGHSITVKASHFSVFAVLGLITPSSSTVAEVPSQPQAPTPGVTLPSPSVTPSVKPEEAQQSGISWPPAGPILGVAVFLAIFLPVRLRKRRAARILRVD
jgi:hypothetical protein